MSTIDTSTWNPDADLNTAIEGIPLNAGAGIAQTWQALRVLMAAVKGDGDAIKAMISVMEGATASADGASGLVPAPQAGDQDKVLKGDGTWGTLSASDIPNVDASKIASGTIDIARLPAGALERLVPVADQAARFALTTADVQLGDTVKQLDTGVMYIVVDTLKLGQATGYVEYTAGSATSVPWSGVTDKPSTFQPSSHTHGNITNDGKLGTASRVVVTDGSKVIDVSSITTTKLGYLTDVTANIQGQIDGKADSATTLAGYGITDAKISSGVITLGSDTITPLTSSSSLNAAKLTGTASVNTTGNAATATKLAAARSLKTKLDSTTAVTFDGSGAQDAIPVTGVLAVANGGTGHGTKLVESTASDFNAYTESGDYHVAFPSGTANAPMTSSRKLDCVLMVRKIGASASVSSASRYTQIAIVQGATTSNQLKIFARKGFSDSGNWTAWSEVAFIEDVQTLLSAKADDSGVVHTAGDESIAGAKTFSGVVAVSGSGVANHSFAAKNANYSIAFGIGSAGVNRGVWDNNLNKWIIYATATESFFNGTVNSSSDERLKTPLEPFPDAVLDAWEDVHWGQFRYLADVERGNAAIHAGVVAQRILEAFDAHGLDAEKYDLVCREETEDGVEGFWMVRYLEALALEAACQRRRADRLEARITALEEKLK